MLGGEDAGAVAVGKDLEETDGVFDVGHKGIDGQGEAETGPDGPVSISSAGA